MSDVSQGAVNKLVKHLQALGYVSLTDADLALVKQAVATFRSSKAAARFMCGVLGGKNKCLTPLPNIDVRGDKASKAPASRIPSPDEIRLRGMAIPKAAAVSKVKPPRMPAVKFSRVVETESSPKAAAMKAKAKPKTTANPKASQVRMPKAARVLLSTLAILERNTLDIEAKATAAHSSLGDKRLSRSKKKAVQKRIEKLSQALDEVVLEVADTERQLAAVAAEHNTTVFELKALRREKAWDKKAKELSAIGAAEDAKLKATLERARALLAQHDAEAAQANSGPKKAECPPCAEPSPAKGTRDRDKSAKAANTPVIAPRERPRKAAKAPKAPKPPKLAKAPRAPRAPKGPQAAAPSRTTIETQPPGREQGTRMPPITAKAGAAPGEPSPKPPREPKRGKAPSPPKNEPTDDGTALVNELAAQLLGEQ